MMIPVVTIQLVSGALFSLQMTSGAFGSDSGPVFTWGGFLPFWVGAAIVTLPAYVIGVFSERNLKGKSSQMTNTKIIFHGISALALTIAALAEIIFYPG